MLCLQLNHLATPFKHMCLVLFLLLWVPPIPTIDRYWHETSCMSHVASAPFNMFKISFMPIVTCKPLQLQPGPSQGKYTVRPSVSVFRATRRPSWMVCSAIGIQNTCTPRRSGPWCVRRWRVPTGCVRSFHVISVQKAEGRRGSQGSLRYQFPPQAGGQYLWR